MTTLHRILAFLCLLTFGAAHAQEEDLKADAVRRVVQAHDPAIFVTTGALYLKQEAIRAAGGKPLTASVLAEVDRIIDAQVRDPKWLYAAWGAAISQHMSAEEADEIAVHFNTEVGQLQRHVMELAIGEVLMSTYTFTNKIDHRLAASARELEDVQRAVGTMRGTCNCPTQREVQDLERVANNRQPLSIRDLSSEPAAVKFAGGGVGVKYLKMLMIQGIGSVINHFESVAKQIREVVARNMG
jgi:hypothetical protein